MSHAITIGRVSICPACKFAAPALAIGKTFCQNCGSEALTSDGTPASLFVIFNQAFPTATPKKIKRRIWEIAQRLVSGELTPDAALRETAAEAPKTGSRKGAKYWVELVAALLTITLLAPEVAQRAYWIVITIMAQIESTTEPDEEDCDPDNPEPLMQRTPPALPLRGTSDPESTSQPRRRGAKSKRRK